MESDKYSENDILNFNYYSTVLDINKLIENDFYNFVNNLDIQNTEKQILMSLFYKYGVAGYKLKECE